MESMEIKQFSHFSHRHPLEHQEIADKDGLICSGCEIQIWGSAFCCTKTSCDFILHDSCIHLPRELRHDSHPNHRLILHFHPPYAGGEFTCNACGNVGHGFTYHCTTCKFDLHVECASLPEIEHREDHDHPFVLWYYSSSVPEVTDTGKGKGKGAEEILVACCVCHGPFEQGRWLYRCSGCSFGAHLDCVCN